MAQNKQIQEEFTHFIWKELVNWSHDDTKMAKLFKDDHNNWKHESNRCVQILSEGTEGVYSHLTEINKKSRKKILKILAKEYVRIYIKLGNYTSSKLNFRAIE